MLEFVPHVLPRSGQAEPRPRSHGDEDADSPAEPRAGLHLLAIDLPADGVVAGAELVDPDEPLPVIRLRHDIERGVEEERSSPAHSDRAAADVDGVEVRPLLLRPQVRVLLELGEPLAPRVRGPRERGAQPEPAQAACPPRLRVGGLEPVRRLRRLADRPRHALVPQASRPAREPDSRIRARAEPTPHGAVREQRRIQVRGDGGEGERERRAVREPDRNRGGPRLRRGRRLERERRRRGEDHAGRDESGAHHRRYRTSR